jgi:hypothetical protein
MEIMVVKELQEGEEMAVSWSAWASLEDYIEDQYHRGPHKFPVKGIVVVVLCCKTWRGDAADLELHLLTDEIQVVLSH